jgi:hypothetical protein
MARLAADQLKACVSAVVPNEELGQRHPPGTEVAH